MEKRRFPNKIRIETENQTIEHVDRLGRARINCRLQFWDKNDNPYENTRVRAFDGKELIYNTDTDIDGRASIEFIADVVKELRKKILFVLPDFGLQRNRIFMTTKGVKSEEDKNLIDDLQLRHEFRRDREEVIACCGKNGTLNEFKRKYQGIARKSWMREVEEALEREGKLRAHAQFIAKMINQKDCNYSADSFNTHNTGRLKFKGWDAYMKYCDRYSLVDRNGRLHSAQFDQMKPRDDNYWDVVYDGKSYLINNNGQFCDETGRVLVMRDSDDWGFPLPLRQINNS